MSGLLDDLVVLDLTRFLSGPYCTLLLAGMGAEVIKLDDPKSGDPTASAAPFAGRHGVAFEALGEDDFGLAYLKRARGKYSACLNLKDEAGRALFLDLVKQADVVVENFRPDVARRLGIDYTVLAPLNEKLIYCAISGYGATGQDKAIKSFDLMAQAASGMMGITGEPDGPPVKIGSAFSDMVAGTYAALGITAAVHERSQSGRGQAIDISMVDCLFAMLMDEPFDCYEQLGLAERQGNRIMRLSPFNAYRGRDGWVVIGAQSSRDWERLTGIMGRAELAQDPDFGRNEWRIANNAAVDGLVAGWVADQRVVAVVATLQDADIPCSPVRSAQDALRWPHLRQRGMIQELCTPDGAQTNALAANLPLRFSRSGAGHTRPAPTPGADTDAILERFLGLDRETLSQLRSNGVV